VPPSDEPLLREPDELSPELRLGLERLRDKRPSAERLAAMAAAVGLVSAAGVASAAAPTGAEGPSGTASSGALASPVAKLMVVAGVVAAGAAALLLLRSTPSAPGIRGINPASSASTGTTAVVRPPAPSEGAAAHGWAASVGPRPPAVPDASPARPTDVAAPVAGSTPNAVAPAQGPAEPDARRAATDPAPVERTPRADLGARAPASAAGRPPAGTKPTEAELLRDARQVLDRNPLVAFSLCEEHQKSYPGGGLTQERELIAVAALLRLGRTSSAESRAARFRESYPRSPYLARLDRLVPP
jgi:hypothetical protein